MIGRLMVPGTIAALVAISLAHEKRGTSPDAPPFEWPQAPEHDEPDELPPPPEEVNPDARDFRLELQSDGTLVDLDEKSRFASLDDFLG